MKVDSVWEMINSHPIIRHRFLATFLQTSGHFQPGRHGKGCLLCAFAGRERLAWYGASFGDEVEALRSVLEWRGGTEFYNLCDPTHFRLCYDVASADMLQLVLDWRGPNGEWVDPRVAYCASGINGEWLVGRGPDFLATLLDWRGPGEEWVDLRELDVWPHHAKPFYPFEDDSAAERSSLRVWRQVLDWRGPGGVWIDVREDCGFYTTDFVRALLQWRGPGGEWVDARKVTQKDLDSIHIVYHFHETEPLEHQLPVLELLEWEGPGGECVDAEIVLKFLRERCAGSGRENCWAAAFYAPSHEPLLQLAEQTIRWSKMRRIWVSAVVRAFVCVKSPSPWGVFS
jgi:hypothetical protein